MKNILIFCMLLIGSLAAQAQTIGTPVAFAKDSTTDVQVKYLAITSAVAITGNYVVAASILPTNKSGTATVTGTLQGSMAGTTWANIGTAVTVNNAGTVLNYGFWLSDCPFKYYRIMCTSTGTGVTILNGNFLIKRKQ